MATLILEEGGKTRRFNLKEGKITIGSGERCTLRLESSDVAEVHAELELAKGGATLRLRKGVAPATVKGRKVSGELSMAHGVPVLLGGAKISVEFEGKEKATLVDRRNVRSRAEAAGARGKSPRPKGAHGRRAEPAGASAPAAGPSRIRARRKGVPSWVIVIGIFLIGGVALKLSFNAIDAGTTDFDVSAVYARAQRLADQGDLTGAQEALARAEGEELTPEWRAKYDEVQQTIDDRLDSARLATENQAGTEYLSTQLLRFEKDRLKGVPDPPKVRVFLQRLAYFQEHWPRHPEIPWAERMTERYSKIVDITQPKTFEDIAFEVKTLTWAMPRDYKKAFALLDGFVEEASGDDYDQVMALIEEKETERSEHFLDRILQAKHDWKKGEKGSAVEWLAQLVTKIGDPKMEDEAADLLLSLPGIEGPLAGYKEYRPEMFEALVQNEKVAAKAQELGLL